MSLSYDNIVNYEISELYIEDPSDISIMGIAPIDKSTWGRIDKILNENYGNIDFMDLVLSINGITDVTELKVGIRILLPDNEQIFPYLIPTQILNENGLVGDRNRVPGVNTNLISKNLMEVKIPGSTTYIQKDTGNNITIGNPKLKIKLSPVTYDPNKGQIKF